MDERRLCARWCILFLAAFGTSACAGLLRGVAGTVADEAAGESGPPASAAAPRTAASPTLDDASASGVPATDASALRDPARIVSPASGPPSAPVATSTYESTPMLGLSAPSFARPYSLMASLSPGTGMTPGCSVGAKERMDVLYAPEGTPVEASAPLGLRVTHRRAPLYRAFTPDPDLRSARAFHSGAVLSGEGRVCGRSFVHYYLDLSLGWRPDPEPVAVSR